MPIAVFGNKVFEITDSKIYTMEGLQYSTSLDTEKQDAEGKKPSTYNKGPGLSGLNFTLKLDVTQGVNPRREMESWEAIKDAAIAYQFILGRSPLGSNKWLLIDIQASGSVIDNLGNMLKVELQLKFDEFVRAGAKKSKKEKSVFPGLTGQNNDESWGYKRENPAMQSMADYNKTRFLGG